MQGIPAPAEAEAAALLEALKWIHQMNIQNIIVETDFKEVVDKLSSDSLHSLELDHTVLMCKEKLSHLQYVEIRYIMRQMNHVAHGLAKMPRLYP